jgi:signal transduction histidine kinase
MARNQTLHPPLTGSDEISQLDGTFHNMANSLKELDRLKQEFQAMITHDLRSPLSAINATLQLLSSGSLGELPSQADTYTKRAKSTSDYLLGLVGDLLDISKLESKELPMEFSTVSVETIVEKSVDAVRPLAERKEIEIKKDTSALEIFADGNRLTRVFVNLLSNAIKFSDKGSSIELSARLDENWLFASVTDHGRGISPDDQRRIFDKFEQIETSDATLMGGTGLGLSICKAIVEAHHGTIGVDSQPGKGSTFWFRIPAESKAENEKPPSASHEATATVHQI